MNNLRIRSLGNMSDFPKQLGMQLWKQRLPHIVLKQNFILRNLRLEMFYTNSTIDYQKYWKSL